jgi:hypothetical protein
LKNNRYRNLLRLPFLSHLMKNGKARKSRMTIMPVGIMMSGLAMASNGMVYLQGTGVVMEEKTPPMPGPIRARVAITHSGMRSKR